MTTIKQPTVPFVFTVPGGHVHVGQKFTIKGKPHESANRFCINFIQNASQMCLFHLDFRFDQDCTVRNTNFPSGTWAEEDRSHNPLHRDKSFKLELKVDDDKITVEINGDHYCDWHNRTPNSVADTLQIQGDVEIDRVKFK